MNCYICGDSATKRHGRANMCPKHHRFLQMQHTAKADKKYVPSVFEIEKLVPVGMLCGDCGTEMNWIDNSQRSSGAVLQHYRDGTLGIVCLSCNTKHGLMPGDSYCDVPKDHKLCRGCKTIKPLTDFGRRSANKDDYPKSRCKSCCLAHQHKWREQNQERYKALNKQNNDKKKLNPDKYRALDRQYYHSKKIKNEQSNNVSKL